MKLFCGLNSYSFSACISFSFDNTQQSCICTGYSGFKENSFTIKFILFYLWIWAFESSGRRKGNCDVNKDECSMALTVFYGQTLWIKSRSLRWDIKKQSLKFFSPTIANLLCKVCYCDLFVSPPGCQLQKKAFAFCFLFNTEWQAFE